MGSETFGTKLPVNVYPQRSIKVGSQDKYFSIVKLIQRHQSGDQVAVTTILLPPLRPRLLKLVVVHPTNSCINMERRICK